MLVYELMRFINGVRIIEIVITEKNECFCSKCNIF